MDQHLPDSFLCSITNTKQNYQYSESIYYQTKTQIRHKGNQYVITAPLNKFETSFLGSVLWNKLIAPNVEHSNIKNLIPFKRKLKDMFVSTQNVTNYY